MDFEIENNVLKKYNGWDEDVIVPDGVTEIGRLAFSGCTSIKSVSLPNSLKKIDDLAFYCCSQLTYIDIPDGVEVDLGNDVFKRSGISNFVFNDDRQSVLPEKFDGELVSKHTEKYVAQNPIRNERQQRVTLNNVVRKVPEQRHVSTTQQIKDLLVQSNTMHIEDNISTVRALGVASIVGIFLGGIITLICAAIGIQKGNAAINQARKLNDFSLISQAESAKNMNSVALGIAIFIYIIEIIVAIVLIYNYT